MASSEITSLDKHFGVVDYAVYQAYLDSGKRDQNLFKQFANNAIHVLMKTGTTVIDNAPIMTMKNRMLQASKDFFALPEETRQKFIFPNYNERGYLGYGSKKKKDYKHMFHADNAVYMAMKGMDFEFIKDFRNAEALQNLMTIKDHVPDFNKAVIAFNDRSYQMGHAFTEVLAHYFELPEAHATEMKMGNNLLRLLHYMPFDKNKLKDVSGITRASAHADISAFTFLLTSDQPGLEIAPKEAVNKLFGTNFITNDQMAKIPSEDWLSVPTGKCIINIGRTVEMLTNGILPATPHQVVPIEGQEGQERFSIPFFYHFPWDSQLNTWQKAIDLRGGENYFDHKGLWRMTIEDYVLHDHMRPWIEPEKPVPIYTP